MRKSKRLAELVLSAWMVLGAGAVQADDERYTAGEFLEQPEFNRSSYISVSLMAANLIAMDNDKEQADCIGDWYSADRKGRNELIYRMMEKHPDYHPMAIIIAIAERECGSFKYISD